MWQKDNAHEEQNDNIKMMECVTFTYAFNHKNCLTKRFIATDGFVLIPVTKIFGENIVMTKNIETLLEANMENGLEIQAQKNWVSVSSSKMQRKIML